MHAFDRIRAEAVDVEMLPEPTLAELLALPIDQLSDLPEKTKRLLFAAYERRHRVATEQRQQALERLLAH